MSSMNPPRYAVAGVLAVVLAAGGYMIGNSGSDDSQAATNAAQTGAPGQSANGHAPSSGQTPQSGQMPQNGQAPQGGQGGPGLGAPATGTAAKKAKAAALARYSGSVGRVDKLQDGSYVVHVITSKGEYHVSVSKAFKVTGADQGGPGGGGGTPGGKPQSGGSAPSGSTS
jgi:hypothetical protein